jgi:transposase-like protein
MANDVIFKEQQIMLKRLVEAGLQGEMQTHLEDEKASGLKNPRNGKTGKSVRSRFGELSIETPRDRSNTYEPILVPKHDRKLGNSVEQKILSLYSMGLGYRQIQSHLQELYSVELSEAQLTNITDKILPVIEEWRNPRWKGFMLSFGLMPFTTKCAMRGGE